MRDIEQLPEMRSRAGTDLVGWPEDPSNTVLPIPGHIHRANQLVDEEGKPHVFRQKFVSLIKLHTVGNDQRKDQ